MSFDPFCLDRFVKAQEAQYNSAVDELSRGNKESHWIWFVFPQLRALGRSSTARHYGLENVQEAAAFWEHPTLGPRLRECIQAMLQVKGKSATAILGEVDALKLRSCLTLFLEVAPSDSNLNAALTHFYGGQRDSLTLSLLQAKRGEV